jgi:hypothetical protein
MIDAIKAAIRKLTEKPASQAILPRKSRKHIRVTYWTFDATIAYYGENGRKLTKRRVATRDVARLVKQARENGYAR